MSPGTELCSAAGAGYSGLWRDRDHCITGRKPGIGGKSILVQPGAVGVIGGRFPLFSLQHSAGFVQSVGA